MSDFSSDDTLSDPTFVLPSTNSRKRNISETEQEEPTSRKKQAVYQPKILSEPFFNNVEMVKLTTIVFVSMKAINLYSFID